MFYSSEEEIAAMKHSVSLAAGEIIPKYRQEMETGEYGRLPALFQEFASLGLAGLSIPEKFQGSLLTTQQSASVIETLASHNLGPAVFLSVHNMVSKIILEQGTEEQKEKYLPALSQGQHFAAFALTEPDAGSDAAALKTKATKEKDSYKLRGQKCYITSAGYADLYLTFAREGSSADSPISAFLLEKDTPGLSFGAPEKKMGCALSPIASVFLENAEVPANNLLGKSGKGLSVALSALNHGRIMMAACALGVSARAIELATAHLKERKQFGKPLSEFQGLQFMLADMEMNYQAARSLTTDAATALDASPQNRANRRYASAAKCFATDAAMKITTDAVQLLGGAGYISDYEVESLMRDAKMLQIVEGTNQIQRSIIAQELLRE